MTEPGSATADPAAWIGREQRRTDTLRAAPARFMQATLDRPPSLEEGDVLPPLWHWLYFLDARPLSELGRDAHPRRGGFLPPVALPRRMWAGGRFTFHAPLRLGDRAERRSVVAQVAEKTGRTGRLCFVTVRHEVRAGGRLAMTEEQDLVFREDSAPGAAPVPPEPAPGNAEFSEQVVPSAVMLFRYSALTFNGHRIHYDADYARHVEGYAGLVFHGPLTATLLVDLACRRHGGTPTSFSFRGLAPIAGMTPFEVEGRVQGDTSMLWARRGDGALAMQAAARFSGDPGQRAWP